MQSTYTGPQTMTLLNEDGILVKTCKGRAKLQSVLSKCSSEGFEANVGVFACGPDEFVKDAASVVESFERNHFIFETMY